MIPYKDRRRTAANLPSKCGLPSSSLMMTSAVCGCRMVTPIEPEGRLSDVRKRSGDSTMSSVVMVTPTTWNVVEGAKKTD